MATLCGLAKPYRVSLKGAAVSPIPSEDVGAYRQGPQIVTLTIFTPGEVPGPGSCGDPPTAMHPHIPRETQSTKMANRGFAASVDRMVERARLFSTP